VVELFFSLYFIKGEFLLRVVEDDSAVLDNESAVGQEQLE
jgi:hypothetical protein